MLSHAIASSFLSSASTLAWLGLPGGTEWIVLLILGLLLFGRRLPEVGRSLGRGIVEFKKGIKGVEDEIEQESTTTRRVEAAPRQELPGSGSRSEAYATAEPARKSD